MRCPDERNLRNVALDLPGNLPKTSVPRCPYFTQCGACALQDVDYADQVRAKETALQELLSRPIQVVPCPEPYNYRYKMAYVAAFGKLGFRMCGDHKRVVDLHQCHLVRPRVSRLLAQIQDWVHELNIEGYDYIRFQGDLRYVVTRDAFSSNQLMVTLTTASTQTAIGPLLDRLAGCVESVVWMVNPTPTDVPEGQVQHIRGLEHIRQRIGHCEFLLGPYSFFQNNLLLVDEMFAEIASHARGFVMDLYCGVGTIGLYCASRVSRILGVESIPQSIDLAQRNAQMNNVTNTDFVAQDASTFLLTYQGPVPDTIIVDPPRTGLPPRLIRKLLRLGPGRIIYVSCNPAAFAEDLPRFPSYQVTSLKAFDMFPQTPHVELVAALDRTGYPPLRNEE